MAKYKFSKPLAKKARNWPLLIAVAILLLLGGIWAVRDIYYNNLKPVSSSSKTVYFTVQQGWSIQQIAASLQQQGLIRSATAFKNYATTKELRGSLQAGTYILSPSMSVQDIVNKMINGDVAKNLLTILPGKRLDQIKQAFAAAGYSSDEIATAFNPASYLGDPAIDSLPNGASLEGYLYPDSFQKTTGTPAEAIVKESLDEMYAHLTPSIVQGFADHGLSVYQGVTLASIINQETDDPAYQPTVAQVFLKRLNQGMPLESNVTANYAADVAGVARSTNIDSPYNTYLQPGLTPGPIGNVTASALKAVAFPSNTDYLYFVADENTHKLYFSTTQDEHNAQAKIHCPNTCE